jgi:16S rRNA (adenine1518-N6/adenine1519-N6)-dimethyltransferase
VQTVRDIKALLEARGLAPRKTFGQNFLIDHNFVRKLVDAAGLGTGLHKGDVVLEVGPGTGVLTEELLERGCRVVAAEIDRGMCALLRERFADRPQFQLVEGDCLEGKHALAPAMVAALGGGPFVLVANLPYGAATPLMMLLMTQPGCRGQFVTIQREVADRLIAKPGTKDYGPLSVLAQVTCEVERIAVLPPSCFWPQPDVTSAMVALRRRHQPLHEDPARLLAFCHEAFSQRRKQLGSVLKGKLPPDLPEGVEPTDRAEALSVSQLMALERCVHNAT